MQKHVRRLLFGFAIAFATASLELASFSPAQAQPSPGGHVTTSGPPPLIDRELFFGDPEIIGAQISPDGRFVAFLKPFNGTRNIWVKRTEEPFDKARPITADTKRPISSYRWSRDAKFVLYAQDSGGDENFNVYAVRPSDQPASGAPSGAPPPTFHQLGTSLTRKACVRSSITLREPTRTPSTSA